MSRKSDWNLAADIAIEHIEKKASGNGPVADIWDVYAEQMSKRKWANEHFNNLIDDTVEKIDALEDEFFREGDRFEDWFEPAVIAMVNGNFSSACLADRDVSDDLPDATFRQMEKDAAFYDDIAGRRGRGRGRDRDDRSGGGRTRDDRGGGGGRVRGERSGSGGNLPERGRGGERVRGGQAGRTRSDDEPGRWGSLVDDSAKESRAPREREEDRYEDERRDGPYEDERPARQERVAADIDRVRPTPEVERAAVRVEGPDHTKPRPYDDFWLEGNHYQAAHLSKWTVTPTGSDSLQKLLDTIPNFTDINQSIPYLVKMPDGTVVEELLKLNADNEYLQEELQVDPDRAETSRKTLTAGINLRAAARGDLPAGEAGSGIPSPTTPTTLSALLKQVDLDNAKLNAAPIVDSLTSAIFTSRSRLVGDAEKTPRVDFHVIRTPVLITDNHQHSLVDQIFTTNNLSDASAKLLSLKPEFDPGLWAVLNERYSNALLRTLRYQFQFPSVKAMSFATDYPKLLNAFATQRGEAESAQFASRVRFINSLVCQNAGQDHIEEFLDDLVDNAKDVQGVVFTEYAAVVTVNHTLDALGVGEVLINPRKDGVAVQPSKNKDLYDVVAQIYGRMDQQVPSPAKVRVYIATSDNYRVEILPYAGRNEAFILALA